MSVFAGAKGRVKKKEQQQAETDSFGSRFPVIKPVLEHLGLYIGLACYTAVGAKVISNNHTVYNCKFEDIDIECFL